MSTEPASQSKAPTNDKQADTAATDGDNNSVVEMPPPPAKKKKKIFPPVPTPIPDVVPPGHVISSKGDPLAAAAEVVNEFVQTLQFKDQLSALKKKVEEYMNEFQDLYSESKKLAKASGEGPSYLSPNCTVKLNHQPMERVKASTAYQARSNELGVLIRNTKLEMSDIELEMMILNCNGHKNEMMEIMATALSLISRYVIVVYELDVDHHDFTSSFLIKHHEELLNLSATPLGIFIQTYKRINDCGHKASTTSEVYNYFFARAAAPEAIATDPSLKAPPKATNNPYQKTNNTSQKTPRGQSSLPTPNNLFASGGNKNNTTSQQQVAPSTGHSATSSISSASTRPNTIVINGVEYVAKGSTSETSPHEVSGESVTLSSSSSRANDFVQASSLIGIGNSNSNPPEIVEQFGKSYLSQEYTDEELREISELEKAADEAKVRAEQEQRRRMKCVNWAIIDSIRAKSTFIEVASPAPEQAPDDGPTDLPPHPSYVSAKSPAYDTAMSVMWQCARTFFLVGPSVFIRQWETNQKTNQLSRISSKVSFEESGKKTSQALFSNLNDGKVSTAAKKRKAAAEKETSTRKKQAMNDKDKATLAAVRKKCKLLEKEIAETKQLLKDRGGTPKAPQANNHGQPPPGNVHKTWVRQPDPVSQEQPVADDANQDSNGGNTPKRNNNGKDRKRYSGKRRRQKKNTAEH
eukprot:scaffold13165_cov55-Cyclotella_meneghiniana.AAC.1